MNWHTTFARMLLMILLAVVMVPAAALAGIPLGATGELLIVVARIDDKPFPEDAFFAEFNVTLDLSEAAPVQGAQLVIAGGEAIDLTKDDDDEWSTEEEWSDFASMKSDLTGTWVLTLDVVGDTDIISEFTFDTTSFTEDDLYPTPTITNPTHLEAGVARDTTLTWTDPTGEEVPHVLLVETENDTYEGSADQEDDSLFGDLAKTDTAWDPSGGLLPGAREFSVAYFDADASLVSTINVTQGTITWLTSGFAPVDYPANKPLLALGSEAIVAFSVPLVEDFESYAIQEDATGRSIDDGGEFVTTYFVLDGSSEEVASVSESLALQSAIVADPLAHKSWSLLSDTGEPDSAPFQDGLLLIGDLPAVSDQPTAGPFSEFFGDDPSNRSPKNLWGGVISLSAREVKGTQPSSYRVLLTDVWGIQVASDEIPLSDTFQEQQLHVTDAVFSTLADPPATVDFSRIVGIFVALFTSPGIETPALELRIDEISIEFVPEPGAWQLGLAAVAALAAVSRGRRRTG